MSFQFDLSLDRDVGPLYQIPRYYQHDAVNAIEKAQQRGVLRQLISLPTGTGKTRIMSLIPEMLGHKRILCIASSTEVVNQIAGSFMRNCEGLRVGVEQAGNYADNGEDVVVATIQSIGTRRNAERLARLIRNDFEVILGDEIHHGVAESFLRTFKEVGIGSPGGPLLVGFTATPFRGDGVSLFGLIDEIVYERQTLEMIQEGWLCDYRAFRVVTETDISKVKVNRSGEFDADELSVAVNTDPRNDAICSALKQHAADRKCVLIFCASVAHAKSLTAAMQDKFGFDAAMVSADTHPEVRKKRMADFAEGRLWALCNVGVYVEGVDNERIDTLVMSRPTRSRLLYTQMRGRGMRPFHGKPDLLVLDIVDVCGKFEAITAASELGASKMDLQGRLFTEAAALVEKAEKVDIPVDECESIEILEAREDLMRGLAAGVREVSTRLEAVSLFGQMTPSEHVVGHSIFPWLRLAPDTYTLGVQGNRFLVKRDTLGVWHLKDNSGERGLVGAGVAPDFGMVDPVARKIMGAKVAKMKRRDAFWRLREPSQATLGKLRGLGVHAVDPNASAGTASDMIDRIIAVRELA